MRRRLAAGLLLWIAGWSGSVMGDEPGSGVDRSNFDPQVSLAEDFYLHVNGGWLERTEIPADKSNFGSFTALADDAEAMLQQLVEQLAKQEHTAGSDEQKVADLYRSFMDLERLDAAGIEPLRPWLDQVTALESLEGLPALMAVAARDGIGNPMGFYVNQDAMRSDRYTIYVTQSGTTLPDRDYYLDADPKFEAIRGKFVAYMRDLLTAAGYGDAQGAAERILALETRLAEAQWTKVENRDPVKTYNAVDRAAFVQTLNSIDLNAMLTEAGLAERQEFVVRQPSYFEKLNTILAETPVSTWRDYYTFRVVDAYATALGSQFDDLHFDFHDRTLSGVESPKAREKRGVDVCNMVVGELLGKLYVKERFTPEAKAKMVELVDNLKLAFAERIKGLDWMSEGTKVQALDKLSKFTTKIGYPDKWRDYSKLEITSESLVGNLAAYARFEYEDSLGKLDGPIDRNEWHMTPQTVNAYYNPLMNEIVFPAAILQPPFFDLNADDAVNYGAIGAVIGHELSHGFDDKGSKYDGDGNLRNWWTVEDRQEFDARSKSLIDQYAAYSPIEGLYLNGELTLGENIGDLGGLNVAYKAYRLSLGDREAPMIDGLTGDQRFFYGWGQIWRRKYREQELRKRLLTDPHSPSQYRANGIVSNMDAFYEAFEVPEGSPMYIAPEQRVRIW